MLDEWIWIHSFHTGSASRHLHHLPGAPASLPEKHCDAVLPPHPPAAVPGTLTQILTIMFHLCFFIQMNETQHQRWDEGNGGRIII